MPWKDGLFLLKNSGFFYRKAVWPREIRFMSQKASVTLLLALVFCTTSLLRPTFIEGQGNQSGNIPDVSTIMGDISGAFSQMEEALRPSPGDMTLEDEYYLGRAVAAEILKTYRPYTADPALTAYLNKICQAIVVNSSRPTLFSGYHVEILDTNEIAAFASPGGHIFFSRGLVALAPSEDALAAVIAHEIAHIQHRHVAGILANERVVQQLNAAADRAASVAARNLTAQEQQAVLFRESLSVSVNTLFRNGYSQEQEFEADRTARLLLISAGYDPAALVEFLGILGRNSQTGNMGRTHPTPTMRISMLGNSAGGTGQSTISARRARFISALGR